MPYSLQGRVLAFYAMATTTVVDPIINHTPVNSLRSSRIRKDSIASVWGRTTDWPVITCVSLSSRIRRAVRYMACD